VTFTDLTAGGQDVRDVLALQEAASGVVELSNVAERDALWASAMTLSASDIGRSMSV
jgi:hypothetical protein